MIKREPIVGASVLINTIYRHCSTMPPLGHEPFQTYILIRSTCLSSNKPTKNISIELEYIVGCVSIATNLWLIQVIGRRHTVTFAVIVYLRITVIMQSVFVGEYTDIFCFLQASQCNLHQNCMQ